MPKVISPPPRTPRSEIFAENVRLTHLSDRMVLGGAGTTLLLLKRRKICLPGRPSNTTLPFQVYQGLAAMNPSRKVLHRPVCGPRLCLGFAYFEIQPEICGESFGGRGLCVHLGQNPLLSLSYLYWYSSLSRHFHPSSVCGSNLRMIPADSGFY